jgi:F-type H+-transporting ATPase subunit b
VSAATALALLFQEAGEHEAKLLGIPMWIWQLANLAAFLAVLYYFVARPLMNVFRNQQLAVEEQLKQARARREEAARLQAEVHERMSQLERALDEIRARGVAEGEAARAELIERADQESERVRREAEQEIARSLASAREALQRAAAELTAKGARDVLAREITDQDRERILEESLAKLEPRT